MIRLTGNDDRVGASVSLWVGAAEKEYMNGNDHFNMGGTQEIYFR